MGGPGDSPARGPRISVPAQQGVDVTERTSSRRQPVAGRGPEAWGRRPGRAHLLAPQPLAGQVALPLALAPPLLPLRLQRAQESSCRAQFRFQLCNLRKPFTDGCT